ncbi:unnamed protein product [Rotaria sp. Silwood2]|nr:unnamed protein product [Rotaria sp. Silwood2]
MALRRCVEHLSSSFSKEQSTYATWIRSHAQHREQARMNRAEQEREQKVNQNRWRWTFQRSHDREQMRHQLPIIKIHSSNKEYVCHFQYAFSNKPLSSIKDWMAKFFRS